MMPQAEREAQLKQLATQRATLEKQLTTAQSRSQRLLKRIRAAAGNKKLQNKLKAERQQLRKKVAARKQALERMNKSVDKAQQFTIPGKPGVPSPTIPPHMSATDMMDMSDAEREYKMLVNELHQQLEQMRIQHEHQKSQVDKDRKQLGTDTNEQMAARGLFHSSIRDSELYDIDAAAATRKALLDRQFDAAAMGAQRQQLAAGNAWRDFQAAMKQKMTENARDRSEQMGIGPWTKEPTPPQTVRLDLPEVRAQQGGGGGTRAGAKKRATGNWLYTNQGWRRAAQLTPEQRRRARQRQRNR